MANLIPLSDLASQRGYDFKRESIYDPTGDTVYGSGGEKIGTVRSALVEPESGKVRYLVVNTGGLFSNKEVLVPVGMGRMEDDAVYFDNLTKDQLKGMQEYRLGMDVSSEYQARDQSLLTGRQVTGREPYDYSDQAFTTPQKLQLLEERLTVDKDRYRAGEVEIGKRVETRTEQVPVTLTHEEVVIERRAVTDGRSVDGATIGTDQTIRVDLEAERANVQKQAVVAEEVDISKRQVSETQTVSETLRREEVEVRETGDVNVRGELDKNKR